MKTMKCTEEKWKISSNPTAKSGTFWQVQSLGSWVSMTKDIFSSNPSIYHIKLLAITAAIWAVRHNL
jgi:hypothetical protein